MTQHTPGPWEARNYDVGANPAHKNAQPFSIWIDCIARHGKRSVGGTIAEVYRNGTGSDDPSVQRANANLIALSPTMLEALKAVMGCPQAAPWLARLPSSAGRASLWDDIKAIVAEVEG